MSGQGEEPDYGNWFRISMRGKLITGFGAVIVLLAVVAVTAYVALTDNVESQRTLYVANFGNARDLARLRADLYAERLDVGVMIEPSRANWEPWRQDMQRRLANETKVMETLLARMHGDPQALVRLDELRGFLADFQGTANQQELRLIEAGRLEEARKVFAGIQRERLIRMRQLISELEDRETRDAQQLVAAAEKKARTQIAWLAALGSTAILVAAVLAVYLHRTIAAYIDEGRRAENEVRTASVYTRSLIEASLDPLVTISPDGKIMDVNEATERATGVPREALIGSDFSRYFTEREKAKDGYRQVLREGFVRDYPLAIRHISGKITEVLYNATVFRSEAGQAQGVFAAARDITERKKAEKALGESQKLLAEICDELPALVAYVDTDLQHRFVNRTFESWFQRSRTEVVGQHISRALGEEPYYPEFLKAAERTLCGERVAFEDWVHHRDGKVRFINGIHIPVFSESGEVSGFVAVVTDATDAKQAEITRLAKERALRETLVREVHHRIKNNLQGVAGLLRQQAIRHPALAEEMDGAISQINSIAIVHGLQCQEADGKVMLCAMTSSIGESLQGVTQHAIEVVVQGEKTRRLSLSKAEAVPLALVLNELMCNAVKHGGHGESRPAVRVALDGDSREAVARISNSPAQLPAGFNFAAGHMLGTGLELVRSLLPSRGAALRLFRDGEGITAELRISPPVILAQDEVPNAAPADEAIAAEG